MTNPDELEALASKVEALTGADREVDLAIHLALEPDGNAARVIARASRGLDGSSRFAWELSRGAVLYEQRNERGDCYSNGGYPVAAYTASLDAAMTLVPEGWKLRQMDFNAPCADDRKWHLNLYGGKFGRDAFVGRGRTPVLAFCAAALCTRTLHPLSSDTEGMVK